MTVEKLSVETKMYHFFKLPISTQNDKLTLGIKEDKKFKKSSLQNAFHLAVVYCNGMTASRLPAHLHFPQWQELQLVHPDPNP